MLRSLLYLWLCLYPRAALAAAPTPPTVSDAGEDPDALVLRGHAALAAKDPALAAALYSQAYALRPVPELLFHLGEAQRALPDGAPRALRSYRRYLREEKQPDPELLRRATTAISDLSKEQDEEKAQRPGIPAIRGVENAPPLAVQTAMAPPPQALSLPGAAPPVARRKDPGSIRRGGLALLGAGAVLGAVGGLLLSQSVAALNESQTAATFLDHIDAHDRATRLLGAGAACLAVAGAAVLTGGGLLIIHHRSLGAEARLSLHRGLRSDLRFWSSTSLLVGSF